MYLHKYRFQENPNNDLCNRIRVKSQYAFFVIVKDFILDFYVMVQTIDNRKTMKVMPKIILVFPFSSAQINLLIIEYI